MPKIIFALGRVIGLALVLGGVGMAAQAPGAGQEGPPPPEFIRQGQALLREGKLDETLDLYQREIAASPKSVVAHNATGSVLDLMGRTAEARTMFAKSIEIAATPAERASAQRGMAMSYAFDNDCTNAVKYQQQVYDYYVSISDFFMQGETANEVARICIEAGDLDAATRWYRIGHEKGLKQADITADGIALWNFRWEHAQARLAARRGQASEARKHVVAARALLDGHPGMAEEQKIFYPYLTGYVAFHTGEYAKALTEFEQANPRDPFIQVLMAQTYEKLGNEAAAMDLYRKAATATGHNAPTAYARPFAVKKLGTN